jgi:uncharacterized protein (DUF2267 family)
MPATEEDAMMTTGSDLFEHAMQTARAWVHDVADELRTDDPDQAYRLLRVWLHTLRDRLPVRASADFAAQLPELLRGVYYEGWEPGKVPVKYGPDEYLLRFAHQAHLPLADVPVVSAAISRALDARLSPGLLRSTLARLPVPVREVVQGRLLPHDDGAATPTGISTERPGSDNGIEALKVHLAALTQALDTLTDGNTRRSGS